MGLSCQGLLGLGEGPASLIGQGQGGKEGLGDMCSSAPAPTSPPDVDECAWDTHLCQEGQRCVNLFGSYHCLPDCRPGFRVAPHGAGCEGDRGMMWGCPYSRVSRVQ